MLRRVDTHYIANHLPAGCFLATFRRKNVVSDIGLWQKHKVETVFGGDFARIQSRAQGEWTLPA